MTDNEIIKALEWHSNDEKHCSPCPYEEHSVTHYCLDMLLDDALSLINRQKEEIERLKGWENLLKAEKHSLIKAEAVKEFAERLTTKIVNTPFGVNCTGETDSYKEGCLHGLVAKQNNVIDMICNLVKEMVGDK